MPNSLVLPPLVLDSGLAAIRRWPSEEARAWVERLVRGADREPRLRAIVAYGSVVRDVEASDDVDLLYVVEGDGLAFAAPPMDVDIRGFSVDTLDGRIAGGDEVLGWSLRFGVPLFEHDGFWNGLRERWEGRLLLPSATAAEERAARAFRAAEGLAAAGDDEAARELQLSALTQQARARLIRHGVFPLSRRELSQQLASADEWQLASKLDALLAEREP